MKIALCISGHLRNYKRLKENFYEFKAFLEKYGHVDTFVITWNNRNAGNSWSVQHGLNEQNSHIEEITHEIVQKHYETSNFEILNYDFFDSNYSPLKYKNFTTKNFHWELSPHIGNPSFGIHNDILISTRMFYLIYRCNILKLYEEFKSKQEYDFVFRIRPDMQFFPNEYHKTLKLDQIEKNKIYIPVGHIWTDQFAYGSSSLMNKYANTFLRISSVHDREIFGDPETVMNECLLELIGSENIIRTPKCGYLLAENPNSHIVYR